MLLDMFWLWLGLVFNAKFFIENPSIFIQLSLRVLLERALFVMLCKLTLTLFLYLLRMGLDGLSLFRLLFIDIWLVIEPIVIIGINFSISQSGPWLLLLWWSLILIMLDIKTLSYTCLLSSFIGQKSLATNVELIKIIVSRLANFLSCIDNIIFIDFGHGVFAPI